jgi:hypothetical protein
MDDGDGAVSHGQQIPNADKTKRDLEERDLDLRRLELGQ